MSPWAKFQSSEFDECIMKNNLNRTSFILMAALAITACSSSDNLPDPQGKTDSVASCNVEDITCVSGQFLANDVVEGLDYACGNVRSVTDRDGFFTCPINSVATFFIGHPDSDLRVELGSVLIKQSFSSSSNTEDSESTFSRRPIRVTPVDLVSGALIELNPTEHPQVQNIVRFLKALDSDGLDSNGRGWDDGYLASNANNHIKISDYTRLLLRADGYLEESILSSDFLDYEESAECTEDCIPLCENEPTVPGCSLNPSLQEFVKRSIDVNWASTMPSQPQPVNPLVVVPSKDVAAAHMLAGLKSGTSSAYGGLSPILCAFTQKDIYDSGMCEGSPTDGRASDVVFFIDRTGFSYGVASVLDTQAAATNGLITDPSAIFSNFKRVDLKGLNGEQALNFRNGFFGISGEQVSLSAPNTYEWTGVMKLGTIASSKDNYKAVFGEDPLSLSDLGKWKISEGVQVRNGQFFLGTRKPVNGWLDNEVFDSRYPLNLKVMFRYRKSETDCPTPSGSQPTNEAEFLTYAKAVYCNALKVNGNNSLASSDNELYITILPSGNIVTNTAADKTNCDVDDYSDFTPMRGTHPEARIGFVSSIIEGTKLSMTLLFDNHSIPFEELRGVVAGLEGDFPLETKPGASYQFQTLPQVVSWNNFWRGMESAVSSSTTADPLAQGIIQVEPVSAADACAA